MPTITHKMLADKKNEFRTLLASYKKKIEAGMPKYKSSCDNLVAKVKDYIAKQKEFDKTCNARNGERLDKAIEAAKIAYTTYSDIRASLVLIHTTVMDDFDKLCELSEATSSVEGEKCKAEREAYVKYFTDILGKNAKSLEQVTIPAFLLGEKKPEEQKTEEIAENEEKKAEEEPTKTEPDVKPDEPATPSGTSVTSVNIAPITLDVSKIVERAISAAMDKLRVGMERKIEEYIASLVIPAPPTTSNNTGANLGAGADALNTVAEYEEQIAKKIGDICNTLRGIVDGLVGISATASELGEKQQQLSAIQRQINEMQRQAVRDQQGVSVNQRLISEELSSVVRETSNLLLSHTTLTSQFEQNKN